MARALVSRRPRHEVAHDLVVPRPYVKAVQRTLGHASAAMTLDVYTDLFDDDLDAVADALNHGAITQSVGRLWAAGSA